MGNYITVLLPVFNSVNYISFAVKSILHQNFKNFELLIIDDGSIDDTEEVINSFKDTRIVYVKREHKGLAETLNFGLKKASFDWVARMDADDLSHPERLETQVKMIDDKETLLIFTLSAFFKKNKIIFYNNLANENIKRSLVLHSYLTHASVLYNRNFVLRSGGYRTDLLAFEDYELWLRVIDKASITIIPKYLYFTRFRSDSLSKIVKPEKQKIIYNIQEPYYRNFQKFFLIDDGEEEAALRGWREYFFGNRKKARKIFLTKKLYKKDYRIILACLITYLPERFFLKFISLSFRPRLKYSFKKLLKKNFAQERLTLTLKNIQDFKVIF